MKPGLAVEVQIRRRGSELVLAADAGDTEVTVDDATPFDSAAGGLILIDGNVYTFVDVEEIPDPNDPASTNAVLTLAADGLAGAAVDNGDGTWTIDSDVATDNGDGTWSIPDAYVADNGDGTWSIDDAITPGLIGDVLDGSPVDLWSGDQALDDVVLQVAMGDDDSAGDAAIPVVLNTNQRKDWSALEGPLDPPVSVVLTDDLTELIDAPGYTPSIDLGSGMNFPDPVEVAIEAPDVSPAITQIAGNAVGLTVVTAPIPPTVLVDYLINGVTVTADQRTTVINLTDDGSGNPLATDIEYTVTTVAHNAAGYADPSEGVVGHLDPSASIDVIMARVTAGFVLAGLINVGSSMIFDPAQGIVVTQPDGRQTIISSQGLGNQFVGQGSFDALTVLGNYLLQGVGVLAGTMRLGSGVPNPTDKVNVTTSYDGTVFVGDAGFRRRGLASDGTNWAMTDYVAGGGVVQMWAKSDGSAQGFFTIHGQAYGSGLFSAEQQAQPFDPLGGVTTLGSGGSKRYYVLGKDYSDGGYWRITQYTASGVPGNSLRIAANLNGDSCAIGNDGTNLLVARRISTGELVIQSYDTTAALLSAISLGTNSAWSTATITGIDKAVVDTGTARYVITTTAGIFVFNASTGARIAGEEWPPNGGVYGVAYDSGWHTFNGTLTVSHYTGLIGTWDFSYEWADTDTGGLGIARSLPSQVVTKTPTRRAQWTVSIPKASPDDGTNDGANTAVIVAAPTGSTMREQFILADGDVAHTFTSLVTSGTAAVSVSGFAARPGALGQLAATSGGFTVAGDSSGDWPGKLTKSGTVASGAATTTNASGYVTLTVAPGFTPRQYEGFSDNSAYKVSVDMANSTSTSIRVYFRDVTTAGSPVVVSTNVGAIRWVAIP